MSLPEPPVIVLAAGGAGDRRGRRQRRGIDVLEIRDVGGVAAGLIGVAQIDRAGRLEHQRVDARTAIDRALGTVIRNGVVARAGRDQSAPPPPSIVSLPEPVVMVLASESPVTAIAVVRAAALRFSKLVTDVESPTVWSTPAATVKFTAVTLAPAVRISVSDPVPPSIDVSEP